MTRKSPSFQTSERQRAQIRRPRRSCTCETTLGSRFRGSDGCPGQRPRRSGQGSASDRRSGTQRRSARVETTLGSRFRGSDACPGQRPRRSGQGSASDRRSGTQRRSARVETTLGSRFRGSDACPGTVLTQVKKLLPGSEGTGSDRHESTLPLAIGNTPCPLH
jgi:hypothetical protein